jgi:homoserine kinase
MRSAAAFAPATVSNVAVGFDVLGFAVEAAGDEVTLTLTEGGSVRVAEVVDATGTLAPGAIPLDPAQNTATVGLLKLLEDLRPGFGFDVRLRKGIALGSGMGGSAASAVAALVAANSLLESPLPKESLLAYALAAERVACGVSHPDNAAPSLFGGLTLVVSTDPLRCVRLPVPLDDVVIEPQRAALIPGFARVKAAALGAGALGASISGSGPSVFALADSEETAARVRAAMVEAFGSGGVGEIDSWVSPVSCEGARVV